MRIVVVGAGVGGLAAAVELAHLGHAVTVFERSDAPGGKCARVLRGPYRWDAGPSLLTLPHVFRGLFAATGAPLDEELELLRVEPVTRYSFADGSSLELSADLPRALEALEAWSPGAGADWMRYLATCSAIWPASEAFLRGELPWRSGTRPHPVAAARFRPSATLRDFARAHARDPRLRMIIERFASYAGGDPRRTPAALAVAGYVEHAYGAWHPRGGMHELVLALVRRLAAAGGELRLSEPVERIVVQHGRVRGVRIAAGMVRADAVITDVDRAVVRDSLLAHDDMVTRGRARDDARAGGSAPAARDDTIVRGPAVSPHDQTAVRHSVLTRSGPHDRARGWWPAPRNGAPGRAAAHNGAPERPASLDNTPERPAPLDHTRDDAPGRPAPRDHAPDDAPGRPTPHDHAPERPTPPDDAPERPAPRDHTHDDAPERPAPRDDAPGRPAARKHAGWRDARRTPDERATPRDPTPERPDPHDPTRRDAPNRDDAGPRDRVPEPPATARDSGPKWVAARAVGALVARPDAGRSVSGLTLMLGVRGTTPGLSHHAIRFPANTEAELDDLYVHRRPVRDPTIYVCVPSVTDPGDAPPRHEAWFVLVNAPAIGAAVDWAAEESALLDRLNVRDRLVVVVRRSPAEFEREIGDPGGAIYGDAPHGRLRGLIRPGQTMRGARGLWLVGGSVKPGGGLPLVTLGARAVARAIGPA